MELSKLRGISEKREKAFNKLNCYKAEDLPKLFPRTYLDMTRCTPVYNAYHNDIILTSAQLLNVQFVPHPKNPYVKATLQQDEYEFMAVWFNQQWVIRSLHRGEYFFYGRVQNKYGQPSLINPQFEEVDAQSKLKGYSPVYPLSAGLTQVVVRACVRQSLYTVPFESAIPYALQKKYNLLDLTQAYFKLHLPESQDDIRTASERIAIEEYFVLISAFKLFKGDKDNARVNNYSVSGKEIGEFVARYPFKFTEGQKSAVNEIFANLKGPHKMNRLIQGDVGSGKTAVAHTAIFMAVKSGFQAVMLSPTEVLASQNFLVLQKYFPDFRVGYLSGSMTAKEKRQVKSQIKKGEIDIVCGTHAVIQKDVEFSKLALTVCDEQHRFGVAQRSSLSEKGEGCDMLVMSATPIPRTLSLIFYGDLDVTTIKDKPSDRQTILTSIIRPSKYNDMLNYVEKEARKGNQTYFVCPKIEEDEEGEIKSVTELFDELKEKINVPIGLLHGKMKEAEKNAVMKEFKEGRLSCLVSTTVIEVGVDVPSATIMIIYNAERFGLAQLHQLRGRVGRGSNQSYCFMLLGSDSVDARERLNILCKSNDGFFIAESDLKMRGSGDFMGTKQSGQVITLKNLKYPTSAIFTAKAISDETYSGTYDKELVNRRACQKYFELKDIVLN